MNPNEYQSAAMRTRCPQEVVIDRLQNNPELIALLHSCIGMAGEVGELATAIQRWLWYGKGDFDKINGIEEFGDVTWYAAEGIEALGGKLEDVLIKNIAKLAKRYPEKFTEFLAAEENRDREGERKILGDAKKTLTIMDDAHTDLLKKMQEALDKETNKKGIVDNHLNGRHAIMMEGARYFVEMIRGGA